MFEIFSKKHNVIKVSSPDKKTEKKPSDFREGEIYQMSAGYHVKKPYYVLIEEVDDDFIRTTIPDKHSLKIEYGSYEWGYHIPRMTYVGTDNNTGFSKLLYQPNLITHKK